MMIDAALRRVAADFWEQAGGPEPFPRTMEAAVLWALPLAVMKLPRLGLADVRAWLALRDLPHQLPCANRRLHGCLIAWHDRGFLLMDGADPADERRFTLAHEAAHFMLDYQMPRARVRGRLGAGMVEVLDGLRPATVAERVDAVFAGVSTAVHTHLMERRQDGAFGCAAIAGAEGRADRLALELLAPADEVLMRLAWNGRAARFGEMTARARGVLLEEFGLPRSVAGPYADLLVRGRMGGPTVREVFGF